MTKLIRHPLILVLVVLSAAQRAHSADNSVVVTKVDGSSFNGELSAWDAAGLTVKTDDEQVTVASEELLRIQWSPDGPVREAKTLVELTDGAELPLTEVTVTDRKASITTPWMENTLQLPTKQIVYVPLSPDAPQRDEIEVDADGDLLVVKKKSGALDYLSGVLGDATAEQIQFTWEGEAIPVRRTKVAALRYFHARLPKFDDPLCWLRLTDGGRLPVAEISSQAEEIQVQTIGGHEFTLRRRLLASADYSQGKLAYLSDLKPIEQRWTPRIGLPKSAELIRQHGLPRRDQSFAGSALTLQWPASRTGALDGELRTYSKGLAIRSRTQLRYRIPDGMSRLVTLAGIDPETAREGHITLEIFADRRSIWQGEIAGGAEPTEIDVALGDARQLRIVVDYGKNLDYGDRLHLAEARLSR